MKIGEITSIGRPIDVSYPTNRAIAGLTLLTGAGAAIVHYIQNPDLVGSVQWGISIGLTTFLTWALAREIDPDFDLSAFLAAAIGLVLHWVLGPPILLIGLALIVQARILNRCTGLPIRWGDSIAALGITGWLSFREHWSFALLGALFFLLDWLLAPSTRRHLGFGVASLLLIPIQLVALTKDSVGVVGDRTGLLWSLPILVLFLWVILDSRTPATVCDYTTDRISGIRLQALQVLMLVLVLAAGLFGGVEWITKLGPLVGSLAGVSLFRIPARRIAKQVEP